MIAIISYGSGNIKAFENIFLKMGVQIKIAEKETDLNNITKIIIPGVGSYDETMEKINNSGMRKKLDFYAKKEKIPILGICVGMQIMGYSSEEGNKEGLKWIPGHVRLLPQEKCKRLPHMGWNSINNIKNSSLLNKIDNNLKMYYLHSYYFDAENEENILAKTDYNFDFASVIFNNNIFGIQFHPEKSHSSGIQILKNFIDL